MNKSTFSPILFCLLTQPNILARKIVFILVSVAEFPPNELLFLKISEELPCLPLI